MKEFAGRTAVVTGAASGIGRGLADAFAAEGMNVVLADVEQPALDDAAAEMAAAGHAVLAVRTDVSKREQVEALAQKTIERFGKVHILCNNAGIGGATWENSIEDWEWTLGVNLWGVIYGIRAFGPIMIEQGEEAHIVNTASVAGLIAGAGGPAYTATKYAVVGLSEGLYHELKATSGGKVGISVLCPALTNTRILESHRNHPNGPQPDPEPGTPERMGLDMIREIFKGGMLPSETAQIVLDGIRNERFYILTHPEHNQRFEARAQAIINGEPPLLLMPMPVAP